MTVAQIAPHDFVFELTDPGIWIMDMPAAFVPLSQYLCAVDEYGGNKNANRMMAALQSIVKGTPDEGDLKTIGAVELSRIATGQGKPKHIRTIMELVWDNREKFKAYKEGGQTTFAKYFATNNPLAAMVADKMFGLDCIGFLGRYIEAAGIMTQYPPLLPRMYLDRFYPVKSVWEIETCGVLVWVKGVHVAVIDSIQEVRGNANPPYAIVTICQCSSGGPQINSRVKLVLATGEYLDFAAYSKEVDGKDVTEDQKKELRKSLTKTGATGYRGGVFFDVQLGDPAPPVRGHVYVGVMPNLSRAWEPVIELD